MSDNTKSPAEIERENIKVTANNADNEPTEEKDDETSSEQTEEDNKENTEDNQVSNEETDEGAEEVNKEEIKEAKSIEKLEKTIQRLQKRLDKYNGTNKELQRELAEAKASLEAKQADGEVPLTEEDINKRAKQIASEELAKKEFELACERINKAATAIDKTFDKKVWAMAEDIGPIPGHMISILDELDNGGPVLNYLTDNVDEAEEIYKLTPGKMAARLARISNKLIEKKNKPISKVPPPVEPVGGNGGKITFDPYDTKNKNDRDWIEQRNRQIAERQAAKRNSMR